jgi:glycosyltransferase involved in cell wall biosynthesis
MKIAYIYDAVYPWIKGGAEKRIYEIGRRLADKGHEVHWYGIGWWFGDCNSKTIEHDEIILHGVCKPMELYVDGRRSIKEAIYFARKLLPKLIKEKFDVIDCQEFPYFPCFSAKVHSLFRRIPLVITWHEIWDKYWFEYLGKKGLFGWIAERITAKLTNKNVAVSERTKKDLESLGVKNVEVIHNGIDFKKIESVKPSEEESDIVFAGRLIKDKNVDVLIKAISLIKRDIPDIKCIIIGDGPEKKKLMNLANELKVENNVKFVGFLENHDDVVAYMKSSKVFVLPSTREGFGIVALEANACGLPVVTVNHRMNAACDFINNGENGYICELSAEDIAKKVLIGLEMGNIMKRKCIENAIKYDWSNMVDLTESFYERVKL